MSHRRFGISTHLFHEARLSRDHLVEVAVHDFDAIEVFATRAHFDYHDTQAIETLGEWLTDTRLELHSMHAPIIDAIRGGAWVGSFSNASADETRRKAAIAEAAAALNVAAHIPYRYLVVHLGMPSVERVPPGDNNDAAARRSVEEIVSLASQVHVKVALEVIPNPLSSAAALVRFIEEELEDIDVGICLDYGHAHIMGDLNDAIEIISGHLFTTHVHDNGGTRDDHLVPFAGAIDWSAAMMETQKIGYEGALMFEVANGGQPNEVLRKAATARERLDKLFVTF